MLVNNQAILSFRFPRLRQPPSRHTVPLSEYLSNARPQVLLSHPQILRLDSNNLCVPGISRSASIEET